MSIAEQGHVSPLAARRRAACGVRSPRGFTLAEMILLIVVVSVGLAGIALSLQQAAFGSSDPVVEKQVVAIAESLMEEILLLPYSTPSGEAAQPYSGGGTRATFNSVDDWAGFTTTGIQDIEGTALPSLSQYGISPVAVTATTLNSQTAKLITVTVTGPSNHQFKLDGYKLNYVPGTSP